MNDAKTHLQECFTGDLVLKEIWQAKEALSATYKHDLDRLFADARKSQEISGHKIVDFSKEAENTSKQ
jgi:hypothetical protein